VARSRHDTPAPRRSGTAFEIEFEGERLRAADGETLAATLIANGRIAMCWDKRGEPRGPFCGMGVCHDCLVTVNGRLGERACLTQSEPGLVVKRQTAGRVRIAPKIRDLAALPEADLPERALDMLVVGAGPGGLTAALAARERGVEVVILDERPAPGGQYYKQPAVAARRADAQASEGRALIDRVIASGVAIESRTLVWGAARVGGGLEVMALRDGRSARIWRPRALIVATGAFERPSIVPGWTLPGVMTTGAAQTLTRSYRVTPGRRILVAGNGPLNFQVALELAELGSEVVVAEAAPPPWTRPAEAVRLSLADVRLAQQGLDLIARLKRAGGRVLWRHRLIAVEGEVHAERAILARSGADGMPGPGSKISLEIDAVLTGDGFRPADELPRWLGGRARANARSREPELERDHDGATSEADIFVVGEAGGFGGAHVARAQGELAGLAVARKLGRPAPEAIEAKRALASHHRFQKALWSLFAARPADLSALPASTILCRCEALSHHDLRTAVARHAIADIGNLKRLTRAGMGRCQGRYCGGALSEIFGLADGSASPWAPQMPLRPVPLAALALEKSEWRGHKRALLPPSEPEASEPLDVVEVDALIIGAGVVGLSTALFLARAGRSVLVVDHSWPNSGASGANAGSLHAQLLSFDFGAGAALRGGPAALTLPLQIESIRLWSELERELVGDFEIKITGGLMLAEDERDLAFLEAKTVVERAQGVEAHVIDRNALRDLEPALDERFVGAAFCPEEGKINPLVATQALWEAALAAGASIRPKTTVTAIERDAQGFRVVTRRGTAKARRVVNAAGGFASRIGAMLDLDVPVFGAPLQMIVTEAAEPVVKRLVAHARRHLTLKQAANGNFVIGGGWTAGLDPVRHHPRPSRASLEGNLWIAQHVLPALRKLRVLRSWGAINIDIDGAPILGQHPGVPGFFNAVSSNGYTLGPILGKTTAELILTGKANRDISAFGIERFADAARRTP
jgi:glycine/D-amino acid oxidase-like deaminating enzyme